MITPAALTVAVAATNPVQWGMFRVPNVDFLSLNFANVQALRGSFVYSSPRYAVDKVVAATAAQGSILPIKPPNGAPNASWALDFAGPSIICSDLLGSTVDSIQKNIQAAVTTDNCETAFGYIAWTPSYILSGSAYELYTMPFVLSPNNTSYSLKDGSLGPRPLGDELPPIPATFYAATYPNMTAENGFGAQGLGCKEQASGGSAPLQNIKVIQCELHNSSYHASFSFINGEQTVDVTMDKAPLNSVLPIFVLDMTSAYGPLANYSNDKPIPVAYKTAEVETLSYQAVMASFGSVVVGTLWNSQGSNGGILANGTSVMSTVLGEAEELGWMNDYPPKNGDFIATLQQAIASEDLGQMWNGLDVADDVQSAIPFKVALESLFQNITIGLMSSKLLQYVRHQTPSKQDKLMKANQMSLHRTHRLSPTSPSQFSKQSTSTPRLDSGSPTVLLFFLLPQVSSSVFRLYFLAVLLTRIISRLYFGQRDMQIWKPQFSQRMLTARILYRSIWRRQVFCFPMIMSGGREEERVGLGIRRARVQARDCCLSKSAGGLIMK